MRDSFGAEWNLMSMSELFVQLQQVRGQQRRLAWRVLGALGWALWTYRNKLAIEGLIPSHSANYVFKWATYFQQWRPLGKRQDSDAAAEVLRKIQLLHVFHRST